MVPNCDNCAYWYAECYGAPCICHGCNDQDCIDGQNPKEDEVNG